MIKGNEKLLERLEYKTEEQLLSAIGGIGKTVGEAAKALGVSQVKARRLISETFGLRRFDYVKFSSRGRRGGRNNLQAGVYELAKEGKTPKEIAEQLEITVAYVYTLLRKISDETGEFLYNKKSKNYSEELKEMYMDAVRKAGSIMKAGKNLGIHSSFSYHLMRAGIYEEALREVRYQRYWLRKGRLAAKVERSK